MAGRLLRGSAKFGAALGIAAGWLLVGHGLVARAQVDVSDPCSLVPPGFVEDVTAEGPAQVPWCGFVQELEGDNSVSVLVADYGSSATAQAAVQQEIADNPAPWATTSQWGDVAYEATGDFLGAQAYSGIFARGSWVARGLGCCPSTTNARAALAYVDAALLGAVVPGGSSAPPPTATASGPMSVGIACGVREDAGLRLLACTASLFDAAEDAELTYAWRLDGVTRSEAGSELQIDIAAENIAPGHHAIGVTVRDLVNGVEATASIGVDTETAQLLVTLTCRWTDDGGLYEVSCLADVTGATDDTTLTYVWTLIHPGGGRSFTTQDGALGDDVQPGIVTVSVQVTDVAGARASNTAVQTLNVNVADPITNILTRGQTSDPQNVLDALKGALGGAAGAAAGFGAFTALRRALVGPPG